MGAMSKYNGNTKIEWGINTEDFEYKKLSELDHGVKYPARGCFITRDAGYGKGAVIITDTFYASLPERYVPVISRIMQDEEAVAEMKAGKVFFTVSSFVSDKHNRVGYRIDFVD